MLLYDVKVYARCENCWTVADTTDVDGPDLELTDRDLIAIYRAAQAKGWITESQVQSLCASASPSVDLIELLYKILGI